MKCFKKLVLYHIRASFPLSFDPDYFTCRSNRSTEVAIANHTMLSHLEHLKSYVGMLFNDFITTFNMIILVIQLGVFSQLNVRLTDKSPAATTSPLLSLWALELHMAVLGALRYLLYTRLYTNPLVQHHHYVFWWYNCHCAPWHIKRGWVCL